MMYSTVPMAWALFSIDELIDIYARVDNDCVTNYRSKMNPKKLWS